MICEQCRNEVNEKDFVPRVEMLDGFWKRLDEESSDRMRDFLTGIPIFPSHVKIQFRYPFIFDRDESLVQQDSEIHGLRVSRSLIVPGQDGLFAQKRFSAGQFIAVYWGKVLVSDRDNDLKDHECWGNDDRLLRLRIQPFSKFGRFVFIVGSRSSIATYANSTFGVSGLEPNCEFTELTHHPGLGSPFPTFDCFLNWLSICPIELRAIRSISIGEELTADYEYVIRIDP